MQISTLPVIMLLFGLLYVLFVESKYMFLEILTLPVCVYAENVINLRMDFWSWNQYRMEKAIDVLGYKRDYYESLCNWY